MKLRALLLLSLLAVRCAAQSETLASVTTTTRSAATEEVLDQEVTAAVANQKAKLNATTNVRAQIIKIAPIAELASGDGDVATNGGVCT
jgi:hypothetical protein